MLTADTGMSIKHAGRANVFNEANTTNAAVTKTPGLPALEITFADTSASDVVYHSKVFCRRPLGMEFSQKMPISLSRVKGEAADLGIKRGWMIHAVGGVPLEDKTFAEAYQLLKVASESLPLEWLTRDCPCDVDKAALSQKIAPVAPTEIVTYLGRFGFKATGPETWLPETGSIEPHITLGVINGHQEKGNTELHTWYALQCRITLRGSSASFRWQVERRLLHLRTMLHDPMRREIGRQYNTYFNNAHFAKRGGPPGTTKRLEGWLGALAAIINKRKITPAMVGLTLRFLEAPELIRDGGADEVATAIAQNVSAAAEKAAAARAAEEENDRKAGYSPDIPVDAPDDAAATGELPLTGGSADDAPKEEEGDEGTEDGDDVGELPEDDDDERDIPVEDSSNKL